MTPFARRIVADASATIAAAGANTAYARANIRARTKKHTSERAAALIHQTVREAKDNDADDREYDSLPLQYHASKPVTRHLPPLFFTITHTGDGIGTHPRITL